MATVSLTGAEEPPIGEDPIEISDLRSGPWAASASAMAVQASSASVFPFSRQNPQIALKETLLT
jgi:hypothetical protein